MAKSETVRLNLVITARDDARKVFEEFAGTLRSQLEGIAKTLDEALNLKPLVEEFRNTASQMTQALDGVNAQTAVGKFDEAMQMMDASMKSVQTGLENLEVATRVSMEQMTAAVSEQTLAMESRLNKLNQTAKHTSKGFDFFQLQFVGQQLTNTGEKMTGFFKNAISQAIEFDQNIKNSAGSLIAQGQAADFVNAHINQMKSYVLQLGTTGFFSANQVADALNVMAKQGINYNTIMGGALKAATDVAAANQEDLSATSNVISDIVHEMGSSLVSQYGSMGNAMQHVGDIMTVALHHARLSMNDFLNTMKYAGPMASALGLHFSDLAGTIAVLGEHGIRGTQAGTTLRRMLTNLTPATAAARKEMQQLGFVTANGANVFYQANGRLKSMADIQQILHDRLSRLTPQQEQLALKTIFGMYALSGMTAITNSSTKAFRDMSDAMAKNGAANDILKEKEQGAGFQLQHMHATFDTMMKAIGTMFIPIFNKVAKVISNIMAAITKFTETHPKLAKMLAIIAAVAGVLLTLGGLVLGAIATFGMFASVMEGVGAAVATAFWPVTLIIGAVVLAIVALHAAWKHNLGGIQQKTHVALAWITKQFDAAMKYVGKYVMEGVHAVLEWWHKMAPTFEEAIHNIWRAIVWLKPLWKALWHFIEFNVKATFDTVVGVIRGAWKVISGIFQFFGDLLAGHWGKLWGDIKRILSGVVHILWALIDNGFTKPVFNAIVRFWHSMVTAFHSGVHSVEALVSHIVKTIVSLFTGLPSKAMDWGKNMLVMFGHGITSMVDKVLGPIKNIANRIKGLLGFHSPTKEGPLTDSDEYMPNMMKMFQGGVEQQLPHLRMSLGKIVASIHGVADPRANGLRHVINNYSTTSHAAAPMPSRGATQININVDGHGKTNQDVGNELARILRTQLTMVSA